ncbi:MAG: VOC family protein [Gaiellales bacterium]
MTRGSNWLIGFTSQSRFPDEAAGTGGCDDRHHHDGEAHVRRVTGIGGVFFKADNPAALCDWYRDHLGLDVQEWGGAVLAWADADGNPIRGTTVWSVTDTGSDHFAPSTAHFMVNYRVDDLDALLEALRTEGCDVLEATDESELGKFGWVIDPEGNKVELWEPPSGQ